jgi:hypothetical protein
MSTAATTADAASAGEEAESLKEQDVASKMEAAAVEDVLGLADIGADEDADVPGDSPELRTRTRARAGGARGDARRCSGAARDGARGWRCLGGRRRFVCVRAGGEEEEDPAFIGQGTFSPGYVHRPGLKGL